MSSILPTATNMLAETVPIIGKAAEGRTGYMSVQYTGFSSPPLMVLGWAIKNTAVIS